MVRTAEIRTGKLFALTLSVLFLLQGCGGINPTSQPAAIFIPPTIAVTTTPIPIVTSEPAQSSVVPSSDCTNTLAYINDLTVPDGSTYNAGEIIDKRWLVENQGTCNWDARYTLKFIGGEPMSASTEQSLIPALAGSQATIRIQFIAPAEPGKYRSAWQAYTGDGIPFGDPFYMEIEVIQSAPSASN